MSVQVVLLMAGLGSRFRREGFSESKPLIDVAGAPMFVRALEGLDPLGQTELLAVVRREQIDEERIDDRIRDFRPDARLVVVPGLTAGAAYSAAAALGPLDSDQPVVVLDCDLRFTSPAYIRLVRRGPIDGPDVALITFEAHDARYSFARYGADGVVEEVAEKQVISDRAITGAYYFRTAALLGEGIASAADAGHTGSELYMSDVVRALLASGRTVVATAVEEYESYGTPEELASGGARSA